MRAGFSVGGVNWPKAELAGVTDPAARHQARSRVAYDDAAMTSAAGGDLLRVFYEPGMLLGEGPGAPLRTVLGSHYWGRGERPVPAHSLPERIEQLDRCSHLLDDLLSRLARAEVGDPSALALDELDAYVAGVEQFNAAQPDDSRPVRVLLTAVEFPPRWIVETPSTASLRAAGRGYDFEELWRRYLAVHEQLLRFLVRRYVARGPAGTQPRASAVQAFEICNEPDYEWLPDEARIERAADPSPQPLFKYVTELHLPQIPECDRGVVAAEGGAAPQDAPWAAAGRPTTPVVDFDWGPKLDWYVACYASFQANAAGAIRDEARRLGAAVTVVSGGVTHANVDYLARLARANPAAFAHVDAIGVHPYHWPQHDVWDDRFVSPEDTSGWRAASPRRYAREFFKRFDFLREVSALTRQPGPFAGKSIWITEFGIGTKKLGAFNTPIAHATRFIRRRAEPELPGGLKSVVWEDLWDAFLSQVDERWLREQGVGALLLYSLREPGMPGFDQHDDDRCNCAIARSDGTPRLAPETLLRLVRFMGSLTGRGPAAPRPAPVAQAAPDRVASVRRIVPAAPAAAPLAPEVAARAALLKAAPWSRVALPAPVDQASTMLSTAERRLLYWLARDFYTGEGEIVDGGSFAGGSTLSLGHGLRDGGRGAEQRIHAYDLFAADTYMMQYYFEPRGIHLRPGESFRPVFDEATRGIRSMLHVNEGDLRKIGWNGAPIEIFFIDISKMWSVNDALLAKFFPHLIPGRSVVVQQDLVFHECHWLALTMEHLADYFEYVGFVEHHSAVYLHTRAIPPEVLAVDLRALPLARKRELMDRAKERFAGHYQRGMIECARIAMLLEHGEVVEARRAVAAVRSTWASEPIVLKAAAALEGQLRQSA